jgi:hypothetical protein
MSDFIKKLISGILGLISGILGFVTGLLPGKKKSNGFFLELDEASTGAKPAVTAKPKATPTNGTKAVAEAAAASTATEKPASKAVKTAKVESSKNGKAPKAEPTPATVASTTPKIPTETTFAPKYLAPSAANSNGRRRPGANMSAYMDMASQVKTPG